MKQLITVEQFKSLSPLGLSRWRDYCVTNHLGYVLALQEEFIEITQPSIGQLIEFLNFYQQPFTINGFTPSPVDYLYGLWKETLEREVLFAPESLNPLN